MNYCFDFDTHIAEAQTPPGAVRNNGPIITGMLGYNPDVPMYELDLDQCAAELEQAVRAFKRDNPMMYIQRKINLPGRDLGMVFLAGRYLGAYARVPQGDVWNTTIHSGGRYASHTPADEVIDLAYRAQALFNMDFTTVDVAETDSGAIVFEVSAFGGFQGAKDGIGIDAAALYVEHVLQEIQ
jgi:ribosomal protein S6--L-glutamate ligase